MNTKFYLLKIFLVAIGIVAINVNTYSQDEKSDCRVLLHTINDSYEGSCKQGFAHGKGIAQGVDKYEGKFKMGLPQGIGTYTWANGNIYSGGWKKGMRSGTGTYFSASNGESLKGIWKNDEFIREYIEPSYKILYKSNLEKAEVYEVTGGIPGTIEVILKRDGYKNEAVSGLLLYGHSGMTDITTNYIGFKGVQFPFEGNVKFQALNRTRQHIVNYTLDFKINKEGAWCVTIDY
ncbi:MAG: hypothetical protein KOO66_02215 [Bacteroidales bacterium]|nr:hypothetical protein [Bacteroidales bacterium]